MKKKKKKKEIRPENKFNNTLIHGINQILQTKICFR